MKKSITIPGAPAPIGPYSPALMAGNILFVSGQLPVSASNGEMCTGSIAEQTAIVMDNINKLLAEAGMSMENVVKTSIFLADMNDFTEVNGAYATFFIKNFPARETVQVARLPKDARIEISAIAIKY